MKDVRSVNFESEFVNLPSWRRDIVLRMLVAEDTSLVPVCSILYLYFNCFELSFVFFLYFCIRKADDTCLVSDTRSISELRMKNVTSIADLARHMCVWARYLPV